jgi:uncharacterized protein (DUF2126 family)
MIAKNGNVSATTKVERTKIVLIKIDTPYDLIFSDGSISSSRPSTIGVRANAYLVIGTTTAVQTAILDAVYCCGMFSVNCD